MKALTGLFFFLIALVLCTFLAKPIHQKKIERDLTRKVSHLLIEKGLRPPFGIEVTHHYLTAIGNLPSNDAGREELKKDLDDIIGLYADLDTLVPPVLGPPSFHLAEQKDQSVILTGLVRDESEREYLVKLATTSATETGSLRTVDDQLELTDKVAKIQPRGELSNLAPALLSSAEKGFVNWSPSELIVGGVVEDEEQEAAILANAAKLVPEDVNPLNKLEVQPFQDLDFGLRRGEQEIVVTGTLPDAETRDRLLKLVRGQAGSARVSDQTSLALRSRQAWWSQRPETFVPTFLSATKGPARIHYYPDRFVAEGTFPSEADYNVVQKQIAKLPTRAKRDTKLNFIRKPAPAPEPTLDPADTVAAKALVEKLKGLAVYFNSSSAYVKESENEKIDEAAQLILSSEDATQKLIVGGYADLRGNANYNRSLSLKRANAVRDRLIEKGVPAERLTVNHFGEDTSQTSKKDLWKSRRVEISSSLDEANAQPPQVLDFGVERKDRAIVVTGLLPDVETRDRLLQVVKLQAKGSQVTDKTTIAVRSNPSWWAKDPETFISEFLSTTEGPARVHYYSDRFVAEGSFLKGADYNQIQRRIAKFPKEATRETKLKVIEEPVETGPAAELVRELKNLAVYFNSSSTWIKNSENKKIDEAAKLILASTDVTEVLTVGGYADLRGDADSNRALSLDRAKGVRDRLISKGVPADRLTLSHFGEDTSQTAKKDLWKSRRVEISLTKVADQ